MGLAGHSDIAAEYKKINRYKGIIHAHAVYDELPLSTRVEYLKQMEALADSDPPLAGLTEAERIIWLRKKVEILENALTDAVADASPSRREDLARCLFQNLVMGLPVTELPFSHITVSKYRDKAFEIASGRIESLNAETFGK